MDYPGKVITKTQVTPTQISASGNWNVDDAIAAVKNNNWPIAGVPNPISKSLRFNSPDTAYLNRTPATATNRKTFTWSGWVKRSALSGSTRYFLFAAGSFAGSTNTSLAILNDSVNIYWGGTGGPQWTTTAVLRDPSAWYHIVYALDTTQATFGNRLKVYVNGVQLTAWSLQESTGLTAQNSDLYINNNQQHNLGASGTPGNYFDGYMTEINFVDSPVLVGSTTNASTTITLTTGTTTNIGIGWNVGGTNIPSGATVSSITNSTQFVISAAATGTGSSISIGVSPPVSAFGMTNPQTGQWIPKKYTGTYGTNGFYLNFKDATSTTTLGYDYSGNANNWTPTGFVVSPVTSAGNDSVTDVPTPWFAYNTGDVGGVIRGNYCTLNGTSIGANATLSNGNLDISYGSSATRNATMGTFGMSSGKWYWETTIVSLGTPSIGITNTPSPSDVSNYPGFAANGWSYLSDGTKYNSGTGVAYGATYTTNDVIGVAFDADTRELTFYKNGVSQGVAYTGLAVNTYFPAFGDGSAAGTWSGSTNFGQRPFASTPPTGFRSLCTTNLPPPTIGFGLTNQANDYFNVLTYTGNGTDGRTVTGVGFDPDLVWVKGRSDAGAHVWADAVRGSNKNLYSNLTDAETNPITGASGGGIGTVTTDGFVLEQGTVNMDLVNTNTRTYVAWNWKANGTGVSNTAGSTASTVSANTTAGFSIVTYTGTGANATVGHGCQVGGVATAPSMIIIKGRSTSVSWPVWHTFFGAAGNSDYLLLNTTDQKGYAGGSPNAQNLWNSITPTASVFSLGTYAYTNANTTTYVAYCFAAVPGYSAFGSYTGNGAADGPFIYTGFRPAFVLIKASSTAGYNWTIEDAVRSPYNASDKLLFPSLANAENTGTARNDFLSNGFKARDSSNNNASSVTYIYAAFAEFPFQFANAR